MVDLQLINVFCASVEAGSFTEAAARLRISQPAVSKRVRSFESWCGARLLERSRGGVKPTEEGRRVYNHGRKLLEEAERFREETVSIFAQSTRRMRISASYTIGEYLLPGWIDAFQHHEPEVIVELVIGNSENVLGEFVAGKADLCFVEGGYARTGHEHLELERVPVVWDRLILVVSQKHHWAIRESVSVEELLSEPFVSRERGSGTRVVAERAFQQRGMKPPEPSVELASTGAIKRILESGHGYALLSGYVAREELARGELCSPELEGLDLRRSLDLIRRPGTQFSRLAREFLDHAGLTTG